MRIRQYLAVAREMLACCRHASVLHPFDISEADFPHRGAVTRKCSLFYYRAIYVEQIQYRGEANIDPILHQLGSHRLSTQFSRRYSLLWILFVLNADCSQLRQCQELIAKALNPTSLLIYCNKKVVVTLFDRGY